MTKTLVSIIVPLYNAEKYIAETLDSVLAQTYQFWECILIDDGSVDSSKNIIFDYLEKDKRFQYHWQANAGASAARNEGVKYSKGQFIQYLDADDIMLSEKIELMIEANANLSKDVILYCDMILGHYANIHQQLPLRFSLDIGHDITFNDVYKRYALDFGITPVCFLFPRNVIKDMLWDTRLGPGEDMDYFLQILTNKYSFKFFPKVLAIYRDTPSSYSKSMSKSLKAHYRVLVTWAVKKNTNLFSFSKRCALLYKKSLFMYLLKKNNEIVSPKFPFIKLTFFQHCYVVLIYPLTFIFLFQDIFSILIKRTNKYLNGL